MLLNKFYFTFIFFLLSQYSFGQSFAYKTLLNGVYDQEFPLVYPENDSLLNQAILLDTREKEEFEISHLKNARWMGYDTFSLERLKNIPKDQPIVVYCSIGARSQDIGMKLLNAGYQDVYNLYGGIFHWVNEGNPVYKNQTKTNKVHAYSRIWGIWLQKGEKVY